MSGIDQLGPVLYPTDFSEGARAAFRHAVYLAALAGSELYALHVASAEEAPSEPPEFPSGRDAYGQVSGWLRGPEQDAASGGPGDASGRQRPPPMHREVRPGGTPATTILEYASEVDVGTIAMGTLGRRGLRRLVLGSVTEQVIRRWRGPVLAVRRTAGDRDEGGLQEILVAVDLSAMMKAALAWAAILAAATGAELRILHVVASTVGAASGAKRQEIYRSFRGLDVPEVSFRIEVVAGDPGSRISRAAEEVGADLIVTATHGRSGPARLVLGSVTEPVVRRAPCPVLTVADAPR